MKFHIRREDNLNIPLTPLIDVVFLLLLFFMLTATFSELHTLDIQLPTAQADTAIIEARMDVGVDAAGQYYLNGAAVTSEALRQGLSAALQEDAEIVVYLHAHAQASHQAVVSAMAQVRALGVRRLRLATLASYE